MKTCVLNKEKYAALARQAGAEGIVMLRNENATLPLRRGETVSLFGRLQFDYYKSGTGSGGMVNAPYVVSILDALRASAHVKLNENLLSIYERWVQENPFDKGAGWGGEPWSQKEMPVDEDIAAQAAGCSDAAVIIIGRQAGECKDIENVEGSFLLTATEEQLLETVCRHFSRTVVLLNTGNVIDMKWVGKYKPPAVLYVWQGGSEGGNAVHDVLTGTVNPCGRLTDTIAQNIEDYPSTANFGNAVRNFYKEDIYAGYRYFETFAKDKVLYPFGYGLSYTTFSVNGKLKIEHGKLYSKKPEVQTCFESLRSEEPGVTGGLNDAQLIIEATVCNTGTVAGKDVVQIYASAPQGKLGKPARVLAGFAKTRLLAPGELQKLTIEIPLAHLASYDDGGVTGHKSCYVLEAGKYSIYAGENVRDAALTGSFDVPETTVTAQLTQALAPVREFERIKPACDGYRPETDNCQLKIENSKFKITCEPVPLRSYSLSGRIKQNLPEATPCTGDKGYKLSDVECGKVAMDDFTAQLTDEELCCIVRGEGMSSPKVIPGSTGVFGGVTDALAGYGIPIACCVDGPSGIRLDSGISAFSLPGGTALGCTYNTQLMTELYEMLGCEMRSNKIDIILGPGMNIHRNPLNGRNFEYFSEDPLVTGKMAAAQLKGLHKYNVTGTIKHFAANNQEFERRNADAVISERALREIYLKGFEIAVREGGALTIMTTYGPVNGLWTAGSFDLCTTILRGEWGYDGMVMTDWWADINEEGGEPSVKNRAQMVRAQNDVFMLVADSLTADDNLAGGLGAGIVTRGQLLRSAGNICRAIIRLAVMERYLEQCNIPGYREQEQAQEKAAFDAACCEVYPKHIDTISIKDGGSYSFDVSKIDTSMRAYNTYKLALDKAGKYTLKIGYKSGEDMTAQNPVAVLIGSYPIWVHVFKGTGGEPGHMEVPLSLPQKAYLRLFFSHGGLQIRELTLS